MNLLRLVWSMLRHPSRWLALLEQYEEKPIWVPDMSEPNRHRTMWD